MNPPVCRYERKFVVPSPLSGGTKTAIMTHPAFFSAPFPERRINNLYFDTLNFDHYSDHQAGTSERKKVRIRWYGPESSSIQTPRLEFKFKSGLAGWKNTFALPAFELPSSNQAAFFRRFWKEARLPEEVFEEVRNLTPTLFNTYRRAYYQSADKRFRLTVDQDLRIMPFTTIGGTGRTMLSDQMIIELKYDTQWESKADKITRYFPFRLTRSSKYITGLSEMLNY